MRTIAIFILGAVFGATLLMVISLMAAAALNDGSTDVDLSEFCDYEKEGETDDD